MDWIDEIIRDVAELDHNSPEGQPEVMLVTADELRSILQSRCMRPVVAYMATSRSGTGRFTDNSAAAAELESYGWAITPLVEASPNAEVTGGPLAARPVD